MKVVKPDDEEGKGNALFYVYEDAWESCVKILADPPAPEAGTEIEPFKNKHLECMHGKLCPTYLGRVMRVSTKAMELLQEAGYGFSPLFTGDAVCMECESKRQNADEFDVRHRKVMAAFKKAENNKSGPKVWMSKQWLTGMDVVLKG